MSNPYYIFDYPEFYKTLPDYRSHSGQVVKVIRPLRRDEFDFQGDAMFEVVALDGWVGHVWRSELGHTTGREQ